MKWIIKKKTEKIIVGCLEVNKANEFYKIMGGKFIKK